MADTDTWKLTFSMVSMDFRFSDTLGFANPSSEVFVIRESCFLDGGMLGTDDQWRALADVMPDLPAPAGSRQNSSGDGQAQRRPGSARRGPCRLHPAALLGTLCCRTATFKSRRMTRRSTSMPASSGATLAASGGGLCRHRRALRLHVGWGAAWTAAQQGVALDSYRAQAQTNTAKAWLVEMGMAASATFNLKRFGEEHTGMLAESWVQKMEYVYALAADRPDGCAWGDSDLEGVSEPAAALELAHLGATTHGSA